MIEMTGAELVVRLLERQGVATVAGIPGGANLPIYDALSRSDRIRHVLARHEQGAGFIAQGMARVSGTPAVCLASSGPGATNLLTAMADAKLDSVPLVCITGQVARPMIGTDAFQEVDIYGLSIPITKHNFLVRSAAELAEVIPRAFTLARSGRPGPVLVDIPKDVQTETLRLDRLPAPGMAEPGPSFSADDVARAAAMINEAKRPVLYLGGGVIASGAASLARRLAEQADLPTTTTLMALGALPDGHPLSIGMLGMHGAAYTNLVLDECDLLIACGARFDDRATGLAEKFCPDAKIVHIDIDDSEIHKIRNAHVGIRGDAGRVLSALIPSVARTTRFEWRERVAELKAERPLKMAGSDDPRAPYGLVRTVAGLVGPEAIVTTDVGQHQMWVAQAYPFAAPRRWLTSGGLGTMGFGLPAAIGAALARPDATVVCFTGDGSLLMNVQELATAAELGLNVKIVLMNNRSLGLVHQQQTLFYGERLFASTYETPVDFCAVAEGFGIPAHDLSDEHPRAVLTGALAEPGPCLIHAPIGLEEKVFPMVPPGAANRDMIGG